MKRIVRLSLALAMLVSAGTACGDLVEIPKVPNQTETTDPEDQNPEETVDPDGKTTFSAVIETLAEWAADARISIFDGTSTLASQNSAEAGATAKFEAKVAQDATSFLAFCPAVETMTATSVQASLSATQRAVENSFDQSLGAMIAKSSTPRLYFRELTATLSVTLMLDGAAAVKLTTADGTKISGAYAVDYNADDPVVAAESTALDYVQLQGTLANETTYKFVVLPGTFEGYTLTVTDSQGQELASIASTDKIELAAGETADLGEIWGADQFAGAYKITHMWLWGGTGPEYGNSKLYDMFEKASCFDNTGNRGINAAKDDILELIDDGTFKNWAGVDGLHWWMAFDKESTKDKKKSLDISKFYSVLPKNAGSYSISGETITFTLDDGKTVTEGTLVSAGTYELPGCNPAKSVTITTMAIKFVITGGVNSWNGTDPYSDYGVFYLNPRQLYIEIEKLTDAVADASKTTDATVFVEEEDEPEPEFTLADLPGKYKVKELQLNGGSGDDPAFVEVMDKKAGWGGEAEVGKEYDNILEVSVSASGSTINYTAGEDGEFWSYIWKKGTVGSEVDMSHVYGILPHGESNVTLNASTMAITIDDGSTDGIAAKILIPGKHTFVDGNHELTISSGCIGIAFHVGEQIAATPQRWNDVDRFVNAPIDYVMVFEKIVESN